MSTCNTIPPDPLALPDDQFWLEQLIDASIRFGIAEGERQAARKLKSDKRLGLAYVFRSAAFFALEKLWREFLSAHEWDRKMRREAALQQTQVAA